MKVRVITERKKGLNYNKPEEEVTHFIPQYFDERRGWRECYLDDNLCASYYYKLEKAIDVCRAYVNKYAPTVVWEEDINKDGLQTITTTN